MTLTTSSILRPRRRATKIWANFSDPESQEAERPSKQAL
jgi:hypothetical protein